MRELIADHADDRAERLLQYIDGQEALETMDSATAGRVAHAAERRSHTADARSITAMQDVAALNTELAELRGMVGMLAEMIVAIGAAPDSR
ncbi:hypothetical protein [Sphingomonas sp. GB1N7]|uniref:hypothetical protein n=1 Tax=Parasphingomonas caseinilytica TaxID=3096158 RepID=UPI002FC63872